MGLDRKEEKSKNILVSSRWRCSNELPLTTTLLTFMESEYLDLVKAENL